MRHTESPLTNKLLQQVQGKPPQRIHSLNDLMAIDSSVLDSKVHFVRPSKTGTIGTTYGSDEYDRTSIHVSRHGKLALDLPERGRRVYRDGREVSPEDSPVDSPVDTDDEDYLSRQLQRVTVLDDGSQEVDLPGVGIRYGGGPSSPPPKRSANPVSAFMEQDSDGEEDADRALAFFMRRPGTPLPRLCLRTDDSDEDDGPSAGRSVGGQGHRPSPMANPSSLEESDGSPTVDGAGKRAAYFQAAQATIAMDDRTPSLTSDGASSSDESEGPMSPRKERAPHITITQGYEKEMTWQLGLKDSEGCLDGF